MLQMMKEEARLLRKSRDGRDDKSLSDEPLRNCRTAHDRLYLHSSMKRRLAAVMHPSSANSCTHGNANGSYSTNSFLGHPLESESFGPSSFLQQSNSVDSEETMQRLAHAITSHQRNSTADLLDEKSFASERNMLRRANKM